MDMIIARCDHCGEVASPAAPFTAIKWGGSTPPSKKPAEVCPGCGPVLEHWLKEGNGAGKAKAKLLALKLSEFDR